MRVTDSLLNAGWLATLAEFSHLFVGFSGGLDSKVLLHNLMREPTLAGKLSAVHVHHGLSPYADEWRAHCEVFCADHSIPLIVRHVVLNKSANIEEQARIARYDAFSSLVDEQGALLLAHHADDQAETVLLQLMRGAGVDGLAAMSSIKPWLNSVILRPYLQYSRAALEAYAIKHQLNWIEDDSNQDIAFSRNYLRHQVMPLLRARWPGVVGNLARTATHCQQAKRNLQALAAQDCEALSIARLSLSLDGLQAYSSDRLANVLRTWIAKNQIRLPSTEIFNRLITQVIHARADAKGCVEWDGNVVRRYQNTLYLLKTPLCERSEAIQCSTPNHGIASLGSQKREWANFPDELPLDQGEYLTTASAEKGLHIPKGCHIEVCFRQGGESFLWHGQRKALKKLLQQWNVPPWERDRIPLIWIDNELAAVVGFAISDKHYGVGLSEHLYHIEHLCHNH